MILTHADGTPYCGGYKEPCGEEILLDYEIAQELCIHCMKKKTMTESKSYISNKRIGD